MPSLSFSSFTRLCLSVGIFEFFLFTVHWGSWMNDFFHYLGNLGLLFPPVFFLPYPFSLLPFWESHYVHIAMADVVPQISEALFNFRHSFLPQFLKMGNLNWPIFKFTDAACSSLLLLFTSEFFISVIVFSTLEFLFDLFLWHIFYIDIFCLVYFSHTFLLFFIHIVLGFLDHV